MKKSRRNFVKMAGLGAFGTGLVAATLPTDKEKCSTTPRQELGPFPTMKYRTQPDHDIDLTQLDGQNSKATGDIIIVQGKILDTNCQPVAGAIVEIWQANHHGKYRHEYGDDGKSDPNFQGWGQAITNEKGEYRFKTIVPGLYGRRARHIHYKISKRGFHELITQLYFEGDERLKTDGILNSFTHEDQLRVIGKLNKTTETPFIEFNINLDKVVEGSVPAKVLAEYTGKYDLQFKGTYYDRILTNFLGGPYEKAVMDVVNEDNALYFTFPQAPKAELFWKEKDRFDSSAFYDTKLHFERDTNGKVNGVTFTFKDGKGMTGIKV
jgi:protocatechuate 3,4-dioxygenase, beta subunit